MPRRSSTCLLRLSLITLVLFVIAGTVQAQVSTAPSRSTLPPFSHLSSFSLVNSTGPEKITNGAMGAATGWTVGADWTISGGVATKAATGVTTLAQTSANMVTPLVTNDVYKLRYTITFSVLTGGQTPSVGGWTGVPRYFSGTYTEFPRVTTTAALTFIPGDGTSVFTIDNVSLQKVATQTTDQVALFEEDVQNVATAGGLFARSGDGTVVAVGDGGLWLGDARLYVNETLGDTSFGHLALSTPASGAVSVAHTAFGYRALQNNSTGGNGSAFGAGALSSNVNGDNDTAAGENALSSNVDGSEDSAFGMGALTTNVSGNWNSAGGWGSLAFNVSGHRNSGWGAESLHDNDIASDNAGHGYRALYSGTNGGENSGLGSGSLYYNITGHYNLAGGFDAGRFITGGTTPLTISRANVFLGALTKAAADNSGNEIVIGYDATGAGSNTVTLGNVDIITTVLRGDAIVNQLTMTGLDPATITSVVKVGAHSGGATSYGYKVVAGTGGGAITSIASGETTVANALATLDTSNYITITWPVITNATTYKVYRTTGGSTPPMLIYTGPLLTYSDKDGTTGSAGTPETANTSGLIVATKQITGAAGNAGTLTNAPALGDPTFWWPVLLNGSVRYIPAW